MFRSWCFSCNDFKRTSCEIKHRVLDCSKSLDYIISQGEKGRLSIFCGAGVSSWPPANKPLGDELKNYILDQVLRGLPNRGRLHAAFERSDLALEDIISRVGWGIESCLERIFSGRGAAPNMWHHFVASMMERGLARSVFTTNFDPLVEIALKKRGLSTPEDYSIVANERYLLPQSDDPGLAKRPTIFYLHGTYQAWNMCITVPHITDGTLAPRRLSPLTRFLQGDDRTLLVLGYSARDRDLLRELALRPTRFKAEILAVGRTDVLPHFTKLEGCFSSLRGVRLCVLNYREFAKRLGAGFDIEQSRQSERLRFRPQWKGNVESWARKLPPRSQEQICKRVLGHDNPASKEKNLRVTVRFGDSKLELVGDLLLVGRPHTEGKTIRLFSYGPKGGAFVWSAFNRRMRSLGYMNRSRVVQLQKLSEENRTLCTIEEKEIRHYVTLLMREEKHSLIYRGDSKYRKFVGKAEGILRSHSLLHALSQDATGLGGENFSAEAR